MKDYIWFKKYPKGIPHEIETHFESLVDLFDHSVSKYGDMVAFENMGKAITFNELDRLSNNFAAYLLNEAGLKPGDRMIIQMPNLLQYPVAMFGAIRAGIIVVNTNPLYTPREMEHQFTDAGATAIVILANFACNLEKIIAKTQIRTVIITEIGDMLGGLKGTVVNLAVKYIKKMVPAYHLPQAKKFNDVLKAGSRHKYVKPKLKGSDLAFIQYTGGTTGVSKGAMLTQANVVANMEQISAWMIPKLKEGVETMITALPLYHIFALTVNCLAMLKIGAKNVLITNPRDMKAFIKELSKQQFTVITGVNTLFNGLLNQPDFAKISFKRLKLGVGGGMAVQKAVAQKWKEVTGITLAEGYGLTETSPVLTCNPIDGTERIGYIGIPLPGTELIIADDEGNPVPQGEPGEIFARGPQIMPGYWNRPDETGKVFHNGWFKTGDVGIMDTDGFFRIVDRKKEMINVSGFNVYPNEVEDVVAMHPKVLEVGVKGVKDDRSTEAVKVFVVKKDESLTAEELIAFCKQNLTNYKVPRYVCFKKELPKSNVGKILRRLLVEDGEMLPEVQDKTKAPADAH
jgi:long-chain acyl-CoA synthetase